MKTYKELKEKFLSDPEVKAEYEKNKPEYELISQLIGKRIKAGMTQSDVAKKLGTKQEAISRMESGGHKVSINRYFQYANAVDAKLQINVI